MRLLKSIMRDITYNFDMEKEAFYQLKLVIDRIIERDIRSYNLIFSTSGRYIMMPNTNYVKISRLQDKKEGYIIVIDDKYCKFICHVESCNKKTYMIDEINKNCKGGLRFYKSGDFMLTEFEDKNGLKVDARKRYDDIGSLKRTVCERLKLISKAIDELKDSDIHPPKPKEEPIIGTPKVDINISDLWDEAAKIMYKIRKITSYNDLSECNLFGEDANNDYGIKIFGISDGEIDSSIIINKNVRIEYKSRPENDYTSNRVRELSWKCILNESPETSVAYVEIMNTFTGSRLKVICDGKYVPNGKNHIDLGAAYNKVIERMQEVIAALQDEYDKIAHYEGKGSDPHERQQKAQCDKVNDLLKNL